jgi:hypothetical protein
MNAVSDQTNRMTSEIPTGGPNGTDHLPSWFYLWMPILVMILVWGIGKFDYDFYQSYIGTEKGLLEFTHVLMPLISAIVCVLILRMPEARNDRLIFGWIVIALVGNVYLAGEEASWGQHFVGWLTPEYWQALNDQGETNLHNTSSWMDQKPRTLLEIGIIVGGIIIPIAALFKPEIRSGRYAIFLPPLACLPIAVLAEFSRIWERMFKVGITDFEVFVRASEVQEFYFALFIFAYLLVFRRRLAARSSIG